MNRIAQLEDKLIYGDYIEVGDLIIDSPSKILSENVGEIFYYFFSKTWPLFRENGTIWFDGNKLSKYEINAVRFSNGAAENALWHVESVTFKPIPNTQLKVVGRYPNTLGYIFSIQGLKNITIDGFS
ncbi:MAG TPA: hypothetical protein VHM20_08905, partial [Gammaproteobacteria bacterium]|nr:hypothetical protein [Gammaproteobacteria bacterium]